MTEAPLPAEEAVRYLLGARLLVDRDIVVGDLRAEPIAGRHRNVRVLRSTGTGYFIKVAPHGENELRESLAREAAFYAWAHGESGSPALRALVPPFVAFESHRGLLTIGLVPDACNAHELDDREGATPYPRIGRLVGAALAACQRTPRRPLAPRPDPAASTAAVDVLAPPWILGLARPEPSMLRDLSPAQLEIIRRVQSDTTIHDRLDSLRSTWAVESLIHGDLKWGNILVRARAPSFDPEAVWLVDWEFGAWGDPAWDVGSVFHSFVADCVHAVTFDADVTVAAARSAFRKALPRAQEQIRSLWLAYVDGLQLTEPSASARLRRCARCCGARILQSSFEWSHGEVSPPRNAVAALQLGVNLLCAPDADALRVLGFSADVRRGVA